MTTDKFLTPQELAEVLKISTYTAYELIKRGELQAVRVGRQLRVPVSELEQYVECRGVSSDTEDAGPPRAAHDTVVLIGSHDPTLDILVSLVRRHDPPVYMTTTYTGSLEGLIALFHDQATVASAHLWADDGGASCDEYLRHLLPNHKLTVVRVCLRSMGLATAPGNPKAIRAPGDLAKPGVRVVNRQKGSGTRVHFDRLLAAENIDPTGLAGYDDELDTHNAVAMAVGTGQADVGLVCEAAVRASGLDFVPLYWEPYDLVMKATAVTRRGVAVLIDELGSDEFRQRVSHLTGYDLETTGRRWNVET